MAPVRPRSAPLRVHALTARDVAPFRAMLSMFGHAFDDVPTYTAQQPDDAYLAKLPKGTGTGPAPASVDPWMAMDYGPSLMNTYEVGGPGPNLAYKGIAVRLDAEARFREGCHEMRVQLRRKVRRDSDAVLRGEMRQPQ